MAADSQSSAALCRDPGSTNLLAANGMHTTLQPCAMTQQLAQQRQHIATHSSTQQLHCVELLLLLRMETGSSGDSEYLHCHSRWQTKDSCSFVGVQGAKGSGADGGAVQPMGGIGGGAGGCRPGHLHSPHVWSCPPSWQVYPKGLCYCLSAFQGQMYEPIPLRHVCPKGLCHFMLTYQVSLHTDQCLHDKSAHTVCYCMSQHSTFSTCLLFLLPALKPLQLLLLCNVYLGKS